MPFDGRQWGDALVDPEYFAGVLLGTPLHSSQAQWLRNSVERENLLVTGNRWGKSFACAVKALWHAIFKIRSRQYDQIERYRVLLASISQDQANLLFSRVEELVQAGDLRQLVIDVTRTPFPILTFGNRATIEARTTQQRGAYLLGNDFDLIMYDEAAFDPDGRAVVDEVLSLRLADREGMLDLVSTPNGRNWLYQFSRDRTASGGSFYMQGGDSRQNPHVSQEYLTDMTRLLPASRVQQNIMGQFVDSGGQILSGSLVDHALEAAREDSTESCIEHARGMMTGWDLARKQTATVGVTVALLPDDKIRVVAVERLQHFDWAIVLEKIRMRQQQLPGRLVIDGTGLGDVIAEQLRDFRPDVVIFTPATKAELLTNLELMHAQHRIAYERFEQSDRDGRIWSLEDELRAATWDDNNQCDGLMALALAVWPLRKRWDVFSPPVRIDTI